MSVAALCVAAATACGGEGRRGRPECLQTTSAAGGDGYDPSAAAPDTRADPPSWSPPPTETATTGGPVGLYVRGREDQARRVVVRMLEALRDRDTGALEALLADPIVRRGGGDRPRADVIAELLRAAEAHLILPGAEITSLFGVNDAEVRPVGASRRQRASARLRDDDLVVRFALISIGGRRLLEFPFAQGGLVAEVVVRTGNDPRIVGF